MRSTALADRSVGGKHTRALIYSFVDFMLVALSIERLPLDLVHHGSPLIAIFTVVTDHSLML